LKVALDTNILSAIWTSEPSAALLGEHLFKLKGHGTLTISPFTYVECRACPEASEEFIFRFFAMAGVGIDDSLPNSLWRLAGDRFALYAQRRRAASGQTPRRILADFLIGAHALLSADRLMTLDSAFYTRNYPELSLHTLEMQ
jgi:predicted nucleic acid-binding protein